MFVMLCCIFGCRLCGYVLRFLWFSVDSVVWLGGCGIRCLVVGCSALLVLIWMLRCRWVSVLKCWYIWWFGSGVFWMAVGLLIWCFLGWVFGIVGL